MQQMFFFKILSKKTFVVVKFLLSLQRVKIFLMILATLELHKSK